MSKIVEFKSKKGPVYVQVEGIPSRSTRGQQPAASAGKVVEKAKKSFEEALESAKPGIEAALDCIGNLVQKPAEVEIEFGLKINGEAGAVFASAGAEATFNVKLSWKKA